MVGNESSVAATPFAETLAFSFTSRFPWRLRSRFRFNDIETGEGGIRTLGSLLGYGALVKRCFRPLSHLSKIAATVQWAVRDAPQARGYRRELRISPGISAFQSAICNGRYRFRRVLAIFIGVANCPLPTD